jgi:hypothetical protein
MNNNGVIRYAAVDGALSRSARQASWAIGRQQLRGQVQIAGIDSATDATLAKIEDYAQVTVGAAMAVVRVAQAQRQFEQLAPEAAGRLAILVDDHGLGSYELLAGYRRELRRL